MNSRDIGKINRAGFKIFRPDYDKKIIRIATKAGGWSIYKTFKTKKALKEEMKELMKNQRYVEDD